MQSATFPVWAKVLIILVTVAMPQALNGEGVPEAEGIRTGSFRLHPGVFVHGGYDSNWAYRDSADATDLGVFVVRPGLSFRTAIIDPVATSWNNVLRFGWEQYLGNRGAEASSGPEVDVSSQAEFMRQGLFKVGVGASYGFVNGPADDFQQRNYTHHLFTPQVEGTLQPEGGSVFNQRIGYALLLRDYTDFASLNSFQHKFWAVTRWSFLPQTALVLRLEQGIVQYPTKVRRISEGYDVSFRLENINSTPFRVTGGLSGLIFDRINLTLLGGYGYTFYDEGPNDHLFLASVEAGYMFTNGSKLSLGYVRDFADSTFGNYFTFHRVYLGLMASFLQRFEIGLNAKANFQSFAAVTGVGEREDTIIDGEALVSYAFVPGFKAGVTYLLRGNLTDFSTQFTGPEGPLESRSSYMKHLVTVNLSYEF